ncbi:MAG: hypothetical protein HRU50_04975 [Winogradskyella sp.]|uniref:hypothetical protein n=1 Tax=Winogradskyella sp. TaxID=1883156 RepID=UPI0025F2BE09|nr:hypothetical protein [Winogradskyella sp.]NRB59280.1 hypothetical protein [Winogradskyella sp.]
MNKALKEFESSIKKKHSFHWWEPNHEEDFRTHLQQHIFIAIVLKTFEILEWDIVYKDDTSAEAKRQGEWNRWTEKITVSYHYGTVKVKSVSLGNEMWDNGRNSKRVRLFIHAFNETLKTYDREALKKLEVEIEKANNWEDYDIPTSLPQSHKTRSPKLWIPITGGLISALLLGVIIATLTLNGVYIMILFEFGAGLTLMFMLNQLIKMSNYTFYDHLHYILIGMIILTYISNHFFQYQIIVYRYNLEPFGFWDFMKARMNTGLGFDDFNTGWVGLLVSWVLQMIFTYIIAILRLSSMLIKYLINRVPMEVVDFAYYHMVKDKKEEEIRAELTKMGWDTIQDQNEVFEVFSAIEGANEFRRA